MANKKSGNPPKNLERMGHPERKSGTSEGIIKEGDLSKPAAVDWENYVTGPKGSSLHEKVMDKQKKDQLPEVQDPSKDPKDPNKKTEIEFSKKDSKEDHEPEKDK